MERLIIIRFWSLKSIVKRGKLLLNLNPKLLPNNVSLKQAKLKNMQVLLQKHYGEDWKTLELLIKVFFLRN